MTIPRICAGLVIGTLLFAGVTSPVGRVRAAPASDLQAALAMAPAGTGYLAFTDWALLKQYQGASALTSKSGAGQRQRFMASVDKDQAAASAYGVAHFAGHAQAWGWDSTDLVWEISSQSPGYVLRFRDDFDFAPVVARFVARGFTRHDYQGVPIYSHALDVPASWLSSTEFSILNTAVLASQKLLVLSSSLAWVRSTLDTVRAVAPALAGATARQATGARLGTMASAVLLPGAAACSLFSPGALLTTAPAAVRRQFQALLRLQKRVHRYAGLGLGYRDEHKTPVGVLVLHYAHAKDAAADLPLRRSLAQDGVSLVTVRPYRDVLFTLQGAGVVGSDLVLRLRPAGGLPRRLFEMVQQRDMSFALCP